MSSSSRLRCSELFQSSIDGHMVDASCLHQSGHGWIDRLAVLPRSTERCILCFVCGMQLQIFLLQSFACSLPQTKATNDGWSLQGLLREGKEPLHPSQRISEIRPFESLCRLSSLGFESADNSAVVTTFPNPK